MSKSYKLIHVPFEKAEGGEKYLTQMKHGWIEGYWDADEKVCRKYYWRDMEWYPTALYRMEGVGTECGDTTRAALKEGE